MDFEPTAGVWHVPTLVLTGEEHLDRVVPVGSTRAYASADSAGRVRTMPHTAIWAC